MRWVLSLATVAGCYSATAQPGAPCSPAAPFCPDGQSCLQVGGDYMCLAGAPPGADAAIDVLAIDDAPIDARVDAPVDAASHWMLLQTTGSENSPTTSFSATHAGSLIVVGVETDAASTAMSVTDNAPGGGNTYVKIPNSRATHQNTNLGIELWYAAGAGAGATAITVSSQGLYGVVIWEVAGMRTTLPVDGAATTLNDQAASTTPQGAAITTTATGDFVVSIAIVANAVTTMVGNTFTNDKKVHSNGWAHLTSDSAPPGMYQAQWNQPTTGSWCASSAAFFAAP